MQHTLSIILTILHYNNASLVIMHTSGANMVDASSKMLLKYVKLDLMQQLRLDAPTVVSAEILKV